jgi:exosortase C (VPDSG-CTERM-specific)
VKQCVHAALEFIEEVQDSAHVGLGRPILGTLSLLTGLLILGGYWLAKIQGWSPNSNDSLSITILSFLSILLGGGLIFFGRSTLGSIAFPLAFLLFMIPLPMFMVERIETFFQQTSAEAASALFNLSGTPVFRQGVLFQFPTIAIGVAKECSGIHSSLVLFISSLLAGYIFIRNPWKRAVLALAVIPLGIMRNGFRIFTIAMLCVQIDPEMINSPLHRRGGPIFFALSLVPFFSLLFLLQKSEKAAVKNAENPARGAASKTR